MRWTKKEEKIKGPGVRGQRQRLRLPSIIFPIKRVKRCTIPPIVGSLAISLKNECVNPCVKMKVYIYIYIYKTAADGIDQSLRRNSCCILHIICIEGEDINRCTGTFKCTIIPQSTCSWRALVIQIHNDHSNIIVKMSPYSLFYSFYIFVFHFSFLCSLLEGSSHQSFSYPLERKDNISDLLNKSLAMK